VQFNDLKLQHARYATEIERRMQAVLAHGQFILGPEVAELEHALASRVGTRHCIGVGSGTQALELSLRALGIGPGDEVITTPFSWISSAEAIALVGATPVFVDIEPLGFCLDPERIEPAISERTRAILPVSLFGQPADMRAIGAIAARHRLAVIEDAAQSFGARQGDLASCNLSLVGCTSFFPTKPLGCYGDGGAVFTSDDDLANKLRALRSHGSIDRKRYTMLGTNGRLDTLQAAVLLARLTRLDDDLAERRALAVRYTKALEEVAQAPRALPENQHVFAQYTLRHPRRDRLVAHLTERGIPTQIHYSRCLHQHPLLRSRTVASPVADLATREVVSLPLYPGLTDEAQARVIDAVLSLDAS
jgi:UDP-2-acetamido-2-deoxy-ribo-hexuluronate aminotransferase